MILKNTSKNLNYKQYPDKENVEVHGKMPVNMVEDLNKIVALHNKSGTTLTRNKLINYICYEFIKQFEDLENAEAEKEAIGKLIIDVMEFKENMRNSANSFGIKGLKL